MANIYAVNILSGTPEGAKYTATGTTTEIWRAAVPTTLANGDVIVGPTIPPNVYLTAFSTDWDDVDSGTAIVFQAGYTGAGNSAKLIAAGNTTAQTGGIAIANVPGVIGTTFTAPTQILVTVPTKAGTAVAGNMRIMVSYTANP